jgi:hypothetical protein
MPLKPVVRPGWLARASRNWLARLSVMLGALLGFGYLSWYVVKPSPRAQFNATVHTKSLSFLLGYWPDSGGIFNSDTARLNLTLLGTATIRSDNGVALKCSSNSTLSEVKMVSLSTLQHQGVSLDMLSDGHLRYTLTPARGSVEPFVAVQLDHTTSTQHVVCQGAVSKLGDGEWHITPLEPGYPLEFSVDFVPSATRRKAVAVSDTNGPNEEHGIPLASGSTIAFQSKSSGLGPVGSGNQIQLLRSGRVVVLKDGLALIGLENTSLRRLGYEPASQSLYAEVIGSAAKIEVQSGEDWNVETENRLPRQISGNLGSLAGAIATFAGAMLAFLGTCMTIRVGWRQHRERMAFEKNEDHKVD